MLKVKDLQLEKKEPNDKWKPTPEDSKLLDRLNKEFTIASNFRSNYEDQWLENIERYHAKPFYYEDGRAGVVLPIAKIIIESKQATEMKSPPSWAYEPLEYPEDEQIAKILEDVIKKHVWNLKYVDLDHKLDTLNQDKDILGGMYQYVGWRKIFRTIRKYKKEEEEEEETKEDDMDGEEKTVKELKSKLTEDQELYYDDICVDNIYPHDIWLHPLATSVADTPWIKVRKRFDYNTFLETYSDTEFFKNVEKVPKGRWEMAPSGDDSIYKEFTYDNQDQVVVFEHWNKMRDELIMIANGVIIFDGPNPYEHKELPFVDYIDRLQYNTYVGEGEPQRIATIADAINAFINISIEKEKLSASGINLLDDNGSDFDDVAGIFSPRHATRVSDPQKSFVHYEIPGMSASTDKMISMLMDYLIFSTGVDFRQITDLNTSTQATVAAIRREIAQGRLNLNVRRNENRGYKRLGWLLMKLVQQYYPIPLVEKLAGLEGTDKTLKYRKIRVKGKRIEEKPNKKGEFTTQSLRMKSVGEEDYGFFEARPSYIRTKGELTVRVIAESTFAASRELEKANAKDYVGVAASSMETDPTTGQPKPVLSLRYGLEKYVKAMGYDSEKAFDLESKEMDNTAQEEAKKMMGGEMGAPPQGAPAPQGAVPPTQPPATLVGKNSEPIQQLKADLGEANSIQ